MTKQDDSHNKSAFADAMGKLRRERGLSQRRAASELGISQALLSHYENDTREPRLDFVIKVCDYYSVTSDYILGRTIERGDGASRLAAKINEVVFSLEEIRTSETELIEQLKELTKKD